jgi:AcrR family transcriptional regulator
MLPGAQALKTTEEHPRSMASRKRIGGEDSKTRARLLDKAELIMFDEGYAAVSSRRIANELGVSGQLIHYYFRDMNELFLALVRRGSERHFSALEGVLASPDPLRALWNVYDDPKSARRALEYMALSNHRKDVAKVASDHARRLRRLETAVLSRVLIERGMNPKAYPAAGVALVLSGMARLLGMESAMGVSQGHAEVKAMAEKFLRSFNATSKNRKTTSPGGLRAKSSGRRISSTST